MKTERSLLITVGLVGLSVVTLAFVFLFGDSGDIGELEARETSQLEESDRQIPVAAGRVETRSTIQKSVDQETSDAMPESYRKHLGKVIGRVIEEDSTAIPELKVEAITVALGSLIPDDATNFDLGLDIDQFISASDKTDQEGRFELVGLDPRGGHALAFDLGGGRATIRILDNAPEPGEIVDLGDIILGPYVTLIGQVIDTNATPIVGARVRATEIPGIAFSTGIQDFRVGDLVLVREGGLNEIFELPPFVENLEKRLPFPTGLTDEEGRFRIEGVPVGLTTLLVDRSDFLTTHQGPIPTGRSGEKDVGQIVMETGIALRGVVLDTAGEPVSGAEVFGGNRLNIANVALMHPGGKSDAEGRFEVPTLRPGLAYAAARRGPGQGWVMSDPVAVESDEVQLILPANYYLTMRTMGPDGEPIDAKFRMSRSPFGEMGGGPGGGAAPTMFDRALVLGSRLKHPEPGVYTVEKLAPGGYSVRAFASGYVVAEKYVGMPESNFEVDFVFEKESLATVRVVDDKTGKPVEHAKVLVWPDDGQFLSVETAWSRTNVEGRCELSGLGSGLFKASVEHPAYAIISGEFEVPGAETTLRLVAGGAIEGFVLKGGEPPIEPMMVMLTKRGQDSSQPVMPRMRATDPTGHFKITHVDPGTYRVMVYDRLLDQGTMSLIKLMQGGPAKTASVEVLSGETASLSIDLLAQEDIEGPAATLRGVVTISGVPAVDYLVSIRGKGRRRVYTDENGYFDFGRVPAAKTTLRVDPQFNAGMASGGTIVQRVLELSPGEIRDERVNIAAGSLKGLLLFADTGMPAIGAAISARGKELDDGERLGVNLETLSDMQGRFEFSVVPEGDYALTIQSPGYGQERQEVRVLGSGRTPEVFVSLKPEAIVEGSIEIVGIPSEDLRFIWLQAKDENGRRAGDSSVDIKAMTYRIGGLSPGKYTITAKIQGSKVDPLDIQVPQGGHKGLPLRFTPPPSRISGTIELPTLDPIPASMMLIFYDRAKYTVQDTSDPASWTRISRDELSFSVAGLQPGDYTVVCMADGQELSSELSFKNLEEEGLVLVFR